MDNETGSEFGGRNAAEDIDKWLTQVTDQIDDSIGQIVDTDANLLRLKQNIAKEAIAVAHAVGCAGSDQAIRSLLAGGSPSLETRAGAQRTTVSAARHAVLEAVQRNAAAYLRGMPAYSRLLLAVSFAIMLVITLAHGITTLSTSDTGWRASTTWVAVLSIIGVGCILKTVVVIVWNLRGPVRSLAMMERDFVALGIRRVVCMLRAKLRNRDRNAGRFDGGAAAALPISRDPGMHPSLAVDGTHRVVWPRRKNRATSTSTSCCCRDECDPVRRWRVERKRLDDPRHLPAGAGDSEETPGLTSHRRRRMASMMHKSLQRPPSRT